MDICMDIWMVQDNWSIQKTRMSFMADVGRWGGGPTASNNLEHDQDLN